MENTLSAGRWRQLFVGDDCCSRAGARRGPPEFREQSGRQGLDLYCCRCEDRARVDGFEECMDLDLDIFLESHARGCWFSCLWAFHSVRSRWWMNGY